MIRKATDAGQFYTASCHELQEQIDHFNALIDEHLVNNELLQKQARMIIAPHAGYLYSGFTANIAHRILGNSKAQRLVVIGPSHHLYIQGASISLHQSYETPCGPVTMDSDYAKKLKDKYKLLFKEDAHAEHSTETQIPFIHHYLPQALICEIVYGDIDYKILSQLILDILQDPLTAVVISTDLSHFFTLNEANSLDNSCLEAMVALDSQKMQTGPCQACGKTGVLAALDAAKKMSLTLNILDYRTSADVTQDEKSVVGYVSAILG